MFIENDILSNLKLVSVKPTASDTRRVKFILSLPGNGQSPMLSAELPAGNAPITDSDAGIVREIRRINAESDDAFGNVWGNAPLTPVAIYEQPHLLRMLTGCDNLFTENGEPIVWSESKVTATLDIQPVSEHTLMPRLVFAAGETELEAPTPLTSDTLLSGTTIYSIDPIGDNFPALPQVLVEFAPSQIEAFLSFFLSYFSNITPVYKGRKAYFTDAVETAVPTLVLEKVAADQALYLRVMLTIDSLDESNGLTVPLSRSVSISDDGIIMVRNVENPDISGLVGALETLILHSAPDAKARKDVFRDGNFFIVPAETASIFLISHLHEVLRDFKLLGSEKLKEYKVQPVFPKLHLNLSSGIDFLEGDAEIETDPTG